MLSAGTQLQFVRYRDIGAATGCRNRGLGTAYRGDVGGLAFRGARRVPGCAGRFRLALLAPLQHEGFARPKGRHPERRWAHLVRRPSESAGARAGCGTEALRRFLMPDLYWVSDPLTFDYAGHRSPFAKILFPDRAAGRAGISTCRMCVWPSRFRANGRSQTMQMLPVVAFETPAAAERVLFVS